MQSLELKYTKHLELKDGTWDYKEDNTKYSNHGIHTYPAMMIPQIARRLISLYGKDKKVIFDPFLGSGTVLLEAALHDQFNKAYGIDINPLALLISKVKTTPINSEILTKEANNLLNNCNQERKDVNFNKKIIKTPNFFNLEFWFNKDVSIDLTIIKTEISKIKNADIKDFFLVAFSETVRKVSNTRNSEFKLYRMSQESLKKHKPYTIIQFEKQLRKNIQAMKDFYSNHNPDVKINISSEDCRKLESIPNRSVDLIITSPPYGDSKTTVAYGQFSRLALQWLDYDKEIGSQIDKIGLGGIPSKELKNRLNSDIFKSILSKIESIDPKRAKDVLSFYADFNKCINEIDRVVKNGAHLCFVVGNRTVKGIQIPTDKIIAELFLSRGNYKHLTTYKRNIPNKRMPKSNSPTNKKGVLSKTMNEEWIVVLEKIN